MSEFVAGNDPADHTVAEVVKFLSGDDVASEERDRVLEAERAGRNRVGIMSGSGVEDTAAATETKDPEVQAPEVDVDLDQADEDEAPAEVKPLTPDEAIRQTMERLDARKGRNYEDVLATRGARANGES